MFDSLTQRFSASLASLRSRGKISPSDIDNTCQEIRTALLEADVALTVVNGLCSGLLYRPYARDSAAVRDSPVAPSSYEGEPSKPDAQ